MVIGIPIEEMDKILGGNAGEAVIQRIADIRLRLGMDQTCDTRNDKNEATASYVEKVSVPFRRNIRSFYTCSNKLRNRHSGRVHIVRKVVRLHGVRKPLDSFKKIADTVQVI